MGGIMVNICRLKSQLSSIVQGFRVLEHYINTQIRPKNIRKEFMVGLVLTMIHQGGTDPTELLELQFSCRRPAPKTCTPGKNSRRFPMRSACNFFIWEDLIMKYVVGMARADADIEHLEAAWQTGRMGRDLRPAPTPTLNTLRRRGKRGGWEGIGGRAQDGTTTVEDLGSGDHLADSARANNFSPPSRSASPNRACLRVGRLPRLGRRAPPRGVHHRVGARVPRARITVYREVHDKDHITIMVAQEKLFTAKLEAIWRGSVAADATDGE
uniref:Uncharacterized protein n=1 Tax=Oryza brachyantha TaxID=4533 RepID=J3MS90_ORYBR